MLKAWVSWTLVLGFLTIGITLSRFWCTIMQTQRLLHPRNKLNGGSMSVQLRSFKKPLLINSACCLSLLKPSNRQCRPFVSTNTKSFFKYEG